jgi:hypothetical protein
MAVTTVTNPVYNGVDTVKRYQNYSITVSGGAGNGKRIDCEKDLGRWAKEVTIVGTDDLRVWFNRDEDVDLSMNPFLIASGVQLLMSKDMPICEILMECDGTSTTIISIL